MHKIHNQVNKVRPLIHQTMCEACLTEYHTHGKLQAHLLRSHRCRRILLASRPTRMVLPGFGSREDAQRHQQWDHRLPPLRAHGPLPQQRIGQDFSVEHPALFEALIMAVMEYEEDQDFLMIVRNLISQTTISWMLCRATLKEARRVVNADLLDVALERRQRLCATLEHLEQKEA